jgi:transcriptional regulator with XRE-family HTH domain
MKHADFGQQVRLHRDQQGISQEELAQQVEISRNYLSQIERGIATNLSWQLVDKLKTILGIQEQGESDTAELLKKLPPGLEEFAKTNDLPIDDIVMLARLRYRGRQPTTAKEWGVLYKVIKATLEGD